MSGCMRYCVSKSVYQLAFAMDDALDDATRPTPDPPAPAPAPAPAAVASAAAAFAASTSRCINDRSCPARRATSDDIVAGSCAGSPTRRHRAGRRENATIVSASKAAAASSTTSASGGFACVIIACPALESVQNVNVAVEITSDANASACSFLPEPSIKRFAAFAAADRVCSALASALAASAERGEQPGGPGFEEPRRGRFQFFRRPLRERFQRQHRVVLRVTSFAPTSPPSRWRGSTAGTRGAEAAALDRGAQSRREHRRALRAIPYKNSSSVS